MNRTPLRLTGPLAICLLLASLSAAAAQDSLLTLQQCIGLAMRNNLQHLSNYQSLINSHASLERARAPFGLQMEASLELPSYSEVRDVQESVALQTRIQEESTITRVPCITLRESTERPVSVDCGANVLVGSDPDRFRKEIEKVLAGERDQIRTPPLWDGKAAERIAEELAGWTPGL